MASSPLQLCLPSPPHGLGVPDGVPALEDVLEVSALN